MELLIVSYFASCVPFALLGLVWLGICRERRSRDRLLNVMIRRELQRSIINGGRR